MLATTYSSDITPPPYPTTVVTSTNHPQPPQTTIKPIHRRHILASLAATITPFFAPHPHPNSDQSPHIPISVLPSADARGLFQMPPVRLTNRYFLVRAGESEYESLGVINTNPLRKRPSIMGYPQSGRSRRLERL
ncbi:hypothetical protein HanRHA438_Chr08g0367421 [Helianthus annuus]|nr:hypothetical protein HanRHA438_Chr08g0367421 [Helianthus annuus]